jgi:hypothetical protein
MLAGIDWFDLGAFRSGVSLNCNGFWTERLEMCLLLTPSLSRFAFLLVDLGIVGQDLLVAEETECDSSLVCEGGSFLKKIVPFI